MMNKGTFSNMASGALLVTDGLPTASVARPVFLTAGSRDQLVLPERASDAAAAKMMGFDPMSIKFIRLAHERGLGCGDVSKIEVVGEDISQVNWEFSGVENTFASRGQKLIYWGPLKPLENLLLRSPLVSLSFLASNLYHNGYWLKTHGRRRIAAAMETEWGRLFDSY